MINKPNNPAIPEAYTQYTHPPGILISDYYNQPYGYTCYRSSGTKDWLIMYTLSGRGILRNGEDTYECTEGDFTIVPPGTPHNYFTAPDSIWEKLWAHFIPRTPWLEWIHLPKTPFPVIHKKIEDSYLKTGVQNAFKRLLSYNLDIRVANRDELVLNALEEIILLFSNLEANMKPMDPRIKDVLNLLSQDYAEIHQIEDLARKVCLSPSRLAHLFREQVGDTIIETLIKYRLKHAEKRLVFTNRPITEIALETGFNSPDYFTRQFTKYYGTNPSKYRKSHSV